MDGHVPFSANSVGVIAVVHKDGSDHMGSIAVACYKPRPGHERELLDLVRNHLPPLRAEGLVTDRESVVVRCADGTIVEVFEWVSGTRSKRLTRTLQFSICGKSLKLPAGTRRRLAFQSSRICLATSSRSSFHGLFVGRDVQRSAARLIRRRSSPRWPARRLRQHPSPDSSLAIHLG